MKDLLYNFRDYRFGLYFINSCFSCVVTSALISTFMLDVTILERLLITLMFTFYAFVGGVIPMGLTAAILAYIDTQNVDEESIPEKRSSFEWKSLLVQLIVLIVLIIIGHINADFFRDYFNNLMEGRSLLF